MTFRATHPDELYALTRMRERPPALNERQLADLRARRPFKEAEDDVRSADANAEDCRRMARGMYPPEAALPVNVFTLMRGMKP